MNSSNLRKKKNVKEIEKLASKILGISGLPKDSRRVNKSSSILILLGYVFKISYFSVCIHRQNSFSKCETQLLILFFVGNFGTPYK